MKNTILLLLVWLGATAFAGKGDLDKAFNNYWKQDRAKGRLKAAKTILATGADFETLWTRLEAGRPYRPDVETGKFIRTHASKDGKRHHYSAMVPSSYDPNRKYPLHVFLHGGVGRPQWKRDGKWWRHYDSMNTPDRISLFPASWAGAMWWERTQFHNINGILNQIKTTYNIDENKILLIGLSDGGTGAYFQAIRNTTPWAAIMPYIGHIMVLNNRKMRMDGDIHVINLANKPLFVVNTEHDHLYPAKAVEPFISLYRHVGADVTFVAKQGYRHGMGWFPEEAERIRAYMNAAVRQPLPDRLVWETENTKVYNRAHWLLIDQLGKVEGESRLDSFNESNGNLIFKRSGPWGRVALKREGNTLSVVTMGVRKFTLLMSPKQFNFNQTIKVNINEKPAFEGQLTPDPKVLMKWAAEDNDRTMLFGAELSLEVK